uniref:Ribonuclease H2 subunit B n=1 Tax=Rhizophora mucronata TaxID=61149 RepID=A0A2P2J3D0_RHIMU
MERGNGADETRLLVAPTTTTIQSDCANRNAVGCFLSLRHPKSGNEMCYLLTNGVLQELHWFKQSYTSWFLGDYVCRDGRLYTATAVDPVFILLPIFEEARMKKGDDLGKFRQLDDIIFIDGYPGYQHLIPIADNCMQLVCEIKEIGSSKFFRLDDSKVLAWLCCKVSRLKQRLGLLDKNYAAQDKNTLTDAVAILGEYVKDDPWLKLLCKHLKLSLSEVARIMPGCEESPTVVGRNSVSSNLLEVKGSNDSKIKRTGRQGKKAKMETESQNIKEMFSRASRRR